MGMSNAVYVVWTMHIYGICHWITLYRELHPWTFFVSFTHGRNVYAAIVEDRGIHLYVIPGAPCTTLCAKRTCHEMVHTTVHGPVVDDMDHTMVHQFTVASTMGYPMIGWLMGEPIHCRNYCGASLLVGPEQCKRRVGRGLLLCGNRTNFDVQGNMVWI